MKTIGVVKQLARTIKKTADLQIRLINWAVVTDADFEALLGDLLEVRAQLDDAIADVRRERTHAGE
jgi:hypothetical protein